MQRFALLIVPIFLALTGCAPASSSDRSPGTAGPPSITRTGDGYYINLPSDSRAMEQTIAAPPERIWAVLPAVYADLGVPVQSMDRAEWRLGSPDHPVSRQFAGQPISRFLDCGTGVLGIENASQYRITLTLQTSLVPAGDGVTQLQTRVDATGRSNEGVSKSTTPCTSTGLIEKRIADMVHARVQP